LYEKRKGLLNFLIQMDTLQIAVQYMGMAARGFPYMGIGRNLAYRKDLYFKIGGFKNNIDLKWGDDDLFINQIAHKKNTTICAIPQAQTISIPKTNFYDWFGQKRRHMSTAKRYRLTTKMLISIKPLRILLYYSMLIAGLLISELTIPFIISASAIYLLQVFIFWVLKNKIGKVNYFYVFPIVEFVLFVINILIYLSIWMRKPKNWN
jgi:hypothetical protein